MKNGEQKQLTAQEKSALGLPLSAQEKSALALPLSGNDLADILKKDPNHWYSKLYKNFYVEIYSEAEFIHHLQLEMQAEIEFERENEDAAYLEWLAREEARKNQRFGTKRNDMEVEMSMLPSSFELPSMTDIHPFAALSPLRMLKLELRNLLKLSQQDMNALDFLSP